MCFYLLVPLWLLHNGLAFYKLFWFRLFAALWVGWGCGIRACSPNGRLVSVTSGIMMSDCPCPFSISHIGFAVEQGSGACGQYVDCRLICTIGYISMHSAVVLCICIYLTSFPTFPSYALGEISFFFFTLISVNIFMKCLISSFRNSFFSVSLFTQHFFPLVLFDVAPHRGQLLVISAKQERLQRCPFCVTREMMTFFFLVLYSVSVHLTLYLQAWENLQEMFG